MLSPNISEIRQRCLLLLLLFSTVLAVLTRESRHENKINIQRGKEEVKLPLCANVMILYTENSIKKPLKSFKNKFRKVAQYKNIQKPTAFL